MDAEDVRRRSFVNHPTTRTNQLLRSSSSSSSSNDSSVRTHRMAAATATARLHHYISINQVRQASQVNRYSNQPINVSSNTATSSSSNFRPQKMNRYASIDELVQRKRKESFIGRMINPINTIVTGNRLETLYRFIPFSGTMASTYRRVMYWQQRARNIFRWCPMLPQELNQTEQAILSYLKCPYRTYFVDIGKGWDLEHVLIWTLEVPMRVEPTVQYESSNEPYGETNRMDNNAEQEQPFVPSHLQGLPLVMLHGFGSGIALWSLNFDELSLSGKRHLFAIDLLGFGKSSRPKWSLPKYSGLSELQQSKADAETMEQYMVDGLERWRQSIGPPLDDKFIILGHSFGAYLATAYALRYPQYVAHVILADPWGFSPDSHRNMSSSSITATRQLPMIIQLTGRLFLDIMTPLASLRAAGPWGPSIINALRSDLRKKFERLDKNRMASSNGLSPSSTSSSSNDGTDLSANVHQRAEQSAEDGNINNTNNNDNENDQSSNNNQSSIGNLITTYVYHCNAHCRPSGEIAFKTLSTPTGWARMPMLDRIIELDPSITLSFIYGSRSWIDRQSGFQAKYILATASNNIVSNNHHHHHHHQYHQIGGRHHHYSSNDNSSDENEDEEPERVNVHIIQGAGHHVYADDPEQFNRLVMDICTDIDIQMLHAAMVESGNEFLWDDDDEQRLLHTPSFGEMIDSNWLDSFASNVDICCCW
ncbi:hypothetical protein RDWZM_010213 [Blomia tropicalis]|uniref:AB hydrolase-1 domain-containing protein n=1 Tax=Blomia tropicalis TaxID=40697 RepID=A0A9Q0LZ00_BLOTA|nr:hypothetical protein RDWZM_010213 [Blomia tropicalis]